MSASGLMIGNSAGYLDWILESGRFPRSLRFSRDSRTHGIREGIASYGPPSPGRYTSSQMIWINRICTCRRGSPPGHSRGRLLLGIFARFTKGFSRGSEECGTRSKESRCFQSRCSELDFTFRFLMRTSCRGGSMTPRCICTLTSSSMKTRTRRTRTQRNNLICTTRIESNCRRNSIMNYSRIRNNIHSSRGKF